MNNSDIQAAQRYHNGTKHPNGPLMSRFHSYDPSDRPLLYKIYSDLPPIPLPLDEAPPDVPALMAIAEPAPPMKEVVPTLGDLARILHFSAGITKRIKYPAPYGEMPFRAAACTGALYHIELYLVCGDLPDLAAGVYHYEPQESALKQLRAGDYRTHLVEASAAHPAVVHAPAILVATDVFWRNAVKYQEREYRHAFWDSGTILANALAMCAAQGLPATVVAGFVDRIVSHLLDLDEARELSLALVSVGRYASGAVAPAPALTPLSHATAPDGDRALDFPAIPAIHAASALSSPTEVKAWRATRAGLPTSEPSGRLFPLGSTAEMELTERPIAEVIRRRGSARRFTQKPISFGQLSTILERAVAPGIPGDFPANGSDSLTDLYLIANAVEELPSGAYRFHREGHVLELLRAGDFRGEAGYLGLSQELAYDAAVNFFFLANLDPILEQFGNRGYRAAQLDAAIRAGRIYLAAYALELGATGLTFFDDAVTHFFSPAARGSAVMFLIAAGHPARRS